MTKYWIWLSSILEFEGAYVGVTDLIQKFKIQNVESYLIFLHSHIIVCPLVLYQWLFYSNAKP